ncbi:MAG TPA: hypothetical protein VMD53_18630 [Rhizomicrobium sp.]|nr:hypothetical protein [Rhizomicrobium sp.]
MKAVTVSVLSVWFALVAALPFCARAAASSADPGPLTIAKQGSFFVGGHDAHFDTLSTRPPAAPSGTVTVDQVYVHYQIPVGAKPLSLVLIHGCCLTGKTWETTPDGRMGWAEYFVRRGFPTYVIDQAERGRSAGRIDIVNAVKLGKRPPSALPDVFAATHEDAWTLFRFGPAYAQAYPGVRFPLAAADEFWKQMVPDWSGSMPVPNATVPALAQLSAKLGRTVLISHSQSGIYPFQAFAQSPTGIAGIIAVEPGRCPAPDEAARYAGVPILILWGDYIALSARWAPRLAVCRAFAKAVDGAGGKADLVVLPDIGIRGNTHMLMQDDNNLQIADRLIDWMEAHIVEH